MANIIPSRAHPHPRIEGKKENCKKNTKKKKYKKKIKKKYTVMLPF